MTKEANENAARSLFNALNAMETLIGQIQQRIAGLETADVGDLPNLRDRVAKLEERESQIEQLKQRIAELAQAEVNDLADLRRRVEELEKKSGGRKPPEPNGLPERRDPPAMPDVARAGYVIWLDPKSGLVDGPRFVHFSYGPESDSFMLRDYIARRIQYRSTGTRNLEPGFLQIAPCREDLHGVWNLARRWIKANREHGLFVAVDKFNDWREKLTDMTNNWKDYEDWSL